MVNAYNGADKRKSYPILCQVICVALIILEQTQTRITQ